MLVDAAASFSLETLAEAVAKLTARVAALEGQGAAEATGLAEADAPPPVSEAQAAEAQAELEALRVELEELRSENAQLRAEDLEALRAKNDRLIADNERIEGEFRALKLRVELSDGEPAQKAEGLDELRAELEELRSRYDDLLREHRALKVEHELGTASAAASSETGEEGEFSELAQLQTEHRKAQAMNEALERRCAELEAALNGEGKTNFVETATLRFQVAKLTTEKEALESGMGKVSATDSGTGKIEAEDDDKLQQLKARATRRIKRMQEQLEAADKQREFLLSQLAERDSAGGSGGGELTIDQITKSPVFQTMLGNIRRTSREEVTLLHDSVVELGKIHPEAYDLVLDLVKTKFAAASMENPLALLSRQT
jgi:chromosome segregation ATPase